MDSQNKNTVLDAIKNRRSTRSYLKDPVSEEIISEILEAGRHAPSAMNTQATHFYVITSEEKRAELRQIVTEILAETPEQEGMHATQLDLIRRAKEGEVDVTYGAPVLIVTTSVKGSQNAAADCSCALQNMMVAACANELGCVWVNRFFMLRDDPRIKKFFFAAGVTEEEELCGSVALGYAENLETEPLPRTGFPVTYIR